MSSSVYVISSWRPKGLKLLTDDAIEYPHGNDRSNREKRIPEEKVGIFKHARGLVSELVEEKKVLDSLL